MEKDLKIRTKKFSLTILEIVDLLPYSVSTKVVSYQIAKSGLRLGRIIERLLGQEAIMNLFRK